MSPPIIADTPPGVAPVVELGIGDRYDAASIAGLWGTARWSTAGDDNEWGGRNRCGTTSPARSLDISTFIGRDGVDRTVRRRHRHDRRPQPRRLGRLQAADGGDDNLLTVRPGRQIRVGVSVAGGPPQWLWRGTIDTTEPGYAPERGRHRHVRLHRRQGRRRPRPRCPAPSTPSATANDAYRRFNRILDNVRWPTCAPHPRRRQRATGRHRARRPAPAPSSTAPPSQRPATSTATSTAKSRFRRKDWMVWPHGAPVDATIGNVAGGDVCPSGWEVRFGRDDITTRAIVGRPNETPLVIDNAEALGLYGVETWERTDLLPLDNFETDPHRLPRPHRPIPDVDAAHRRRHPPRLDRHRRGRRPARRRLPVQTVPATAAGIEPPTAASCSTAP